MRKKSLLSLCLSATLVFQAFCSVPVVQQSKTEGTSKAAAKVSAASSADVEYAKSLTSAEDRFKWLYATMKDKDTGYFDENGVPYHSIEKLMIEAPDYGHESTSEAASYLVWLEAVNGRISGNWSGIDSAWNVIEKYFIPTDDLQPSTESAYNPSKPATYADEYDLPSGYPSQLQSGTQVGSDPLYEELKSTYKTTSMYGMHWLVDVDNFYGFSKDGIDAEDPVYINTFQRGKMEGCWNTIPQPSWEDFSYGGQSGFLPYFTGDSSYSKQWRYTIASDADARVVQAMYRANEWSDGAISSSSIDKTKKMGDYLRYSMYDKYFMKVGAQSPTAASGKDSCMYLLSWYYAWGGAEDGSWSWKIGSSHSHFGYQNPFAAWVLSEDSTGFVPKSATAQDDWENSFDRQMELYQWLQSDEGGIAGGCTNSMNGRYEKYDTDSTFYGMAYQEHPVYSNPGSNQWFGMQCWSMQRIAEVYYETGDERAKALMDKWVTWVESQLKMDSADEYLPGNLSWSGEPGKWDDKSKSSDNSNLHVTVTSWGHDVGISASLANTLCYYAAAQREHDPTQDYEKHFAIADQLLDKIWTYVDDKGLGDVSTWDEDKIALFYKEYTENADGTVSGVYVPNNYANGVMPYGDKIQPGASFYSIRANAFAAEVEREKAQNIDESTYNSLAYSMAGLESGEAFDLTYHRFWANCDAAIALGVYDELYDDFNAENGGNTSDDDVTTEDNQSSTTTTEANQGGNNGGNTTTEANQGGNNGGNTTTEANQGGNNGGNNTTTEANQGGNNGGNNTTTEANQGGNNGGNTTTEANQGGNNGGNNTTEANQGGNNGGNNTTEANQGGNNGGNNNTTEANQGGNNGGSTEIAVESITLSETDITMKVGEKKTLTAAVSPANATDQTITWSCTTLLGTNPIIIDKNGTITAMSEGTVSVLATSNNGKLAFCTVRIVSDDDNSGNTGNPGGNTSVTPGGNTTQDTTVEVNEVKISQDTLSLSVGNSQQLTASVSPSNATDQTITWQTSDANKVKVTDNGTVIGVSAGTATVFAFSSNGKYAICTVTVTDNNNGNGTEVPGTTQNNNGSNNTTQGTNSGNNGSSNTTQGTNSGNNGSSNTTQGTNSGNNGSSNTTQGTNSGNNGSSNTTQGTNSGNNGSSNTTQNTTIPVTGITISKTTLALNVGASQKLTASVSPSNATDQTITWQTSNPSLLLVDNGTVTALSAGEAIVFAICNGKVAQCNVTITDPSNNTTQGTNSGNNGSNNTTQGTNSGNNGSNTTQGINSGNNGSNTTQDTNSGNNGSNTTQGTNSGNNDSSNTTQSANAATTTQAANNSAATTQDAGNTTQTPAGPADTTLNVDATEVSSNTFVTNTTIIKGSIIKGSSLKYQITKNDASGKEARVYGASVSKLANVNIPNMIVINDTVYKVTSIRAKAFYNKASVKKVTIGKNIKSIGTKAFYKCKKVKTVTIKTTKLTTKNVKSKAFGKMKAKMTIKVPKAKKAAYKKLLIKRGVSKKATIK